MQSVCVLVALLSVAILFGQDTAYAATVCQKDGPCGILAGKECTTAGGRAGFCGDGITPRGRTVCFCDATLAGGGEQELLDEDVELAEADGADGEGCTSGGTSCSCSFAAVQCEDGLANGAACAVGCPADERAKCNGKPAGCDKKGGARAADANCDCEARQQPPM